MSEQTRIANSNERCEAIVAEIRRQYLEHRYVEVDIRVGERQRSSQQNRALHLWFTMLAETLNDAGLDMRKVIKEDVDIPWSCASVKEYLWRPVQKAMFQKQSTTEANRTDYTQVREVVCRHLADRFGIQCPDWPSIDREAS